MTAHLQRAAETTRDPITRGILFLLARGGDCDPAELRAFLSQFDTHRDRVDITWTNLVGRPGSLCVIEHNALGRLVLKPPDQWPLIRKGRIPDAAQLGLPPPKDDLVEAKRTPPAAEGPPPAAVATSKRSNVPDLKRETYKRPEELRDKVLAFVGSRDYAKNWAHPRNDHLFEADGETLASTLRYCIAREQDSQKPIINRGGYLWSLFQKFRSEKFANANP